MSKEKLIREKRGATLAIVAACALLIIVAIVAGFRLSVYLGSSQEMKNSVDAGALNVAKRVFEIKVHPYETSVKRELGYEDCLDSDQGIGLANINRVWAKAYLVNANAQAINDQGWGPAGNGAEEAWRKAKKINDDLYGLLADKASIYVYFNKLISGKPAKLLGKNGGVSAANTSEWATAALYRGEESNILVNDLDAIAAKVGVNILTKDNQNYMQGYNPSAVNGHTFGFVTFHSNEAPHLVANSTFDRWKKVAVPNMPAETLPNAFKETGQISEQPPLGATASAVANPMRTFEMTIPHSYVAINLTSIARIRMDDGHGHMDAYPDKPYYADTGTIQPFKSFNLETKQYNYPQTFNRWLAVTGLLNGYVSLGQELQPNNLWQAINALPGDHSDAINKIVQRVKEFKPGFSRNDLQKLLQAQPIINSGMATTTYFIYPHYTTPDNTDAKVKVGIIGQLPTWLTPSAAPEGQPKIILKETTQKDEPNKAWSNIVDGQFQIDKPKPQWPNYSTDVHRTALSGVIAWQPGTGWGQCLGVLSINRQTEVIFSGWPPQSAPFMDQVYGQVQ